MTETVKRRVRPALPAALVIVMALLGAGTVSNQFKINAANDRLRAQAEAGARGLARQCQLLPISKKLYADALDRHVISAGDYGLIVSTAVQYCPSR